MSRFTLFLLMMFNIHYACAAILTTPVEDIPFETLKGKWVFISYWATWCPPCLDEISILNRFYHAHQQENVILFAVNYDGFSSEKQINTAKTYNIQYPSLIKDPAKSLNLGDIRSLPAMFVFNPQGKLQDKYYGGQTLSALQHYFSALKKDFAQEQPLTPRAYKPSV